MNGRGQDAQCHVALDTMSLRKPLTLTPARIAANRRSAQRSTGPRTARGKARSRMNGLRNGSRSRLYLNVLQALVYAPPCAVDEMARAILTPELAAHPLFAELVEVARQAEMEVVTDFRGWHRQRKELAEAERIRRRPAPILPHRQQTTGSQREDWPARKKFLQAKPVCI